MAQTAPRHEEVTARLLRFLREEVLLADDVDLNEETPLMGGLLDSLGVQMLTDFIEEEFDLELDPRDINAENMRTVSSIARLIERTAAAASR